MSTLIEIAIAIAAFVAIFAARRRDWITFAVSLLAVLIIAGLTIMNTREREHAPIDSLGALGLNIGVLHWDVAKHANSAPPPSGWGFSLAVPAELGEPPGQRNART